MCQAYEGERNYLLAHDAFVRGRGYDAQQTGVLRTDCPERDHPNPEYSDMRQWQMGWDTAEAGRAKW